MSSFFAPFLLSYSLRMKVFTNYIESIFGGDSYDRNLSFREPFGEILF